MTLGKLIERFEDTLLPRTNKQIVWAPCVINHEGVFVPGSTLVPVNMAEFMAEAEAGCSILALSNLIQAYSTHNNLEKGLCVIKTNILNKSVEWTDIKVYT